MAYIFLDESGDLGFNFKKKKTSRYFIVTLLYTERKEPLEKIVKNIFRGSRQIGKPHRMNVLHAYKESRITKERFLKHLNELDVCIYSLSIDKKDIPRSKRLCIHGLYNSAVSKLVCILLDGHSGHANESVHVIASQRETNASLNTDFLEYVQKSLDRYNKNISIILASPAKEKGLQVVDMASWAIYQKYEYEDSNYYDLISKKIHQEVQESTL